MAEKKFVYDYIRSRFGCWMVIYFFNYLGDVSQVSLGVIWRYQGVIFFMFFFSRFLWLNSTLKLTVWDISFPPLLMYVTLLSSFYSWSNKMIKKILLTEPVWTWTSSLTMSYAFIVGVFFLPLGMGWRHCDLSIDEILDRISISTLLYQYHLIG